MTDPWGPWPGDPDSGTADTGDSAFVDTGDDADDIVMDAGIPYWMDAPDAWDTVTIAGEVLPGSAKLVGEVARKLDKKNPKGADGATITDDGAEPTDIEIALVLTTREHWLAYQRIVPVLDPNLAKKKEAVNISHPATALHRINQIYIERLTLPYPGQDPQTREVKIKATGWLPGPKKPAKSGSTTPAAAKAQAESQQDALNYYNDQIVAASQMQDADEAAAAVEQAGRTYEQQLMDSEP